MAREKTNEENGEKRTPSQFFLELSKTKMPRIDENREINDPSQSRINNITIKRDVSSPIERNSLRIKKLDLSKEVPVTDGVISKKKMDWDNEVKNEHFSEVERPAPERIIRNTPKRPVRRSHSKKGLVLIAFFVIASAIFTLSKFFTGATVYVEPKTELKNIALDLNMKRDSSDGLSFERVNLSASVEKPVSSSGTQNLEVKSKGKAILYNNYSTTPQKLLINTRLEAPDGKIYFTDVATTIPGRTTKGGEVIPGSVEVGITAEKAGEEYNGDAKDFVFVGFKGTPKEKGFYARGKGETTGGFVGVAPIVSESDKQGAIAMLEEEIKTKLLSDVSLQVPSGYIVRDTLSFINFGESEMVTRDGSAFISLSGNIDAFIIPIENFDKVMASKNISGYNNESIRINNRDSILISIKNKESVQNPGSLTSVDVSISGDALFVYGFPQEDLIKALDSKKKKDFSSIISNFPTIKEARVVLKPFFARVLPESKDIAVIETLPDNSGE